MKSFLDSMRFLKENLAAFIFLVSVLCSILGVGTAIGVNWLDKRISMHTDPLVDILMWDLTDSGRLKAYKAWKAEKEANEKAFEMRDAGRYILDPLERRN